MTMIQDQDVSERATLSEAWVRHRRLLAGLVDQEEAGWRGCFGLALLFDTEFIPDRQRLLVPNRSARWVTMLDIPTPNMGIKRTTHFVTICRTALLYGVPKLDQSCVVSTYDFNSMPGAAFDIRLMRVLNHVNDAMTSHAFCYRPPWHRWLGKLAEYAGLNEGERAILAGSRRYKPSECWNTRDFLPEPMVRIQGNALEVVWDRLTSYRNGYNGPIRTYNVVLRDAFCRDVVNGLAVHSPVAGVFTGTSPGLTIDGVRMTQLNFRSVNLKKSHCVVTSGFKLLLGYGDAVEIGTVVGYEAFTVPGEFKRWSRERQWHHASQMLNRRVFDVVVGTWFDAQVCQPLEDGTVLLPANMVGAHNAYAQDSELWWDVAPACIEGREMFNDKADAFIFPPVPMSAWNRFHGVLGSAFEYDLTPFSNTFRQASLARRHAYSPIPTFRDGKTGDPGAETVPVVLDPELPLATPAGEDELERIAMTRLKRDAAKRRQKKGAKPFPAGEILLDDELDAAVSGNR